LFGKTTPTDIDFYYDFNWDLICLGEGKTRGTEIKAGQRMAIEGLAKRLRMGGAHTLVFFFSHTDETERNKHGHFLLNKCLVEEVQYNGVLQKGMSALNVKELMWVYAKMSEVTFPGIKRLTDQFLLKGV
jgi:hypothetical protein